MNPSNSCRTVLIFGIGKGFLTNLLFTSPKPLKKHMVLSFLGIMKDGKAHSDAGCLSNTPSSHNLYTSLMMVTLSRCQNTSGSIYFYGIVCTKTNYIKIHLSVTIKINCHTSSYKCRIDQNERSKLIFKSIFSFGFGWVPSIFVSHNFHVRKENALHPSEAGPAILDGVTTELLTLVQFPKYYFLLRV